MQFFALNKDNLLISSHQALKQEDYYCRECKGIVRVRGGIQRKKHFFHLKPSDACRQSQKSASHLQVQYHLLNLLPKEECQLERRFPEIDRIADVAWENRKLIFEVQCSAISPEEVLSRNADYGKVGYQVVWIFHDRRYNKWKISPAEISLNGSPHYFTNMNHAGNGEIYDQLDLHIKGRRHPICRISGIQLSEPRKLTPSKASNMPERLTSRLNHWPLYFSGDLIDRWKQSDSETMQRLAEVVAKENQFFGITYLAIARKLFYTYTTRPYLLFFHLLLERLCR